MSYGNKVSACIVTYNSADKIGLTVSSLKQHTKLDYKLFIFDNGSTDSTKEAVLTADESAVFTENGENLGFGKANNLIIPHLDSEYLAIINPDIRLSYDVLSQITEYMDLNPDIVLVTPKIVFPDGAEQVLPKLRPTFKYLLARRTPFFKKAAKEYIMEGVEFTEPTEIGLCSGCFSVIRSEVFKALGGFDERFFMYMEDADLTLRAKEYGKTVFLPNASVIHEWERSSSKSLKYLMIHISSMIKFLIKHRKTR